MNLQQLIAKRQQRFIEDRLRVTQWCEKLVASYQGLPEDLQKQLPPLPGLTPQQLLPSLFTDTFDTVAYENEAGVLRNIHAEMTSLALRLNEEAMRCLSD